MKVATQRISFDNGKTMTARWLSMGTDEMFLQKDAAVLLGVSAANIKQIVARNELLCVTMSYEQKEYLTKTNVISKKDHQSKLLPRDTMDALVKIVNTTEAWVIWAQIMNAARDPAASVAQHQSIGGLDQVAKLANESLAVMAVSITKQDELIELCKEKLYANNIQPSNSKYVGSTYHNGTLNSFYKHLNSTFAPTMADDMTGRDFFTRVLHADNYQDICDYVKGFEMSKGLRRTLKEVQRRRDALLAPAINGGKIYNTKKSER
jgi:hypothetical protein